MKKILVVFLSLVLCTGLMLAVFGCGGAETPDNPPSLIYADPDLEEVQNFSGALDAFNFAKNYFENEATDYVTYLSGIAAPQGIGGLAGDQIIYSEKYKSSKTDNFLYTTCNYGNKIGSIDPAMAYKVYKEDNSNVFQTKLVLDRYNETNNPNGVKDNGKDASPRYTADFKDVIYENRNGSSDVINQYGNDPTKLLVYIVNEDTIDFEKSSDDFDFKELPDGSYTFSFELNENSVENYKTQVKQFSTYNYKQFKSVNIKFTLDKYGRMKKIECKDTYVISYMSTTTIATTIEEFYYGYIPDIKMVNGNPQVTLEIMK